MNPSAKVTFCKSVFCFIARKNTHTHTHIRLENFLEKFNEKKNLINNKKENSFVKLFICENVNPGSPGKCYQSDSRIAGTATTKCVMIAIVLWVAVITKSGGGVPGILSTLIHVDCRWLSAAHPLNVGNVWCAFDDRCRTTSIPLKVYRTDDWWPSTRWMTV